MQQDNVKNWTIQDRPIGFSCTERTSYLLTHKKAIKLHRKRCVEYNLRHGSKVLLMFHFALSETSETKEIT